MNEQFGCPELLLVIIMFLEVGCKFDILACFFIAWTGSISLKFSDNCFIHSLVIYTSLVRQVFLQLSFSLVYSDL